MRRQRRKTLALLAVALLAGGIGVLAYGTHLLRRSELQTIDARFSIRGKQSQPSDVVLVGIDDRTLQELRNHQLPSQFPFPRRYDAQAIDHLRSAGAKAIVLDIEFTHPSSNERETKPCSTRWEGHAGKPRSGLSKSQTADGQKCSADRTLCAKSAPGPPTWGCPRTPTARYVDSPTPSTGFTVWP